MVGSWIPYLLALSIHSVGMRDADVWVAVIEMTGTISWLRWRMGGRACAPSQSLTVRNLIHDAANGRPVPVKPWAGIQPRVQRHEGEI